MLTKSYGFCVDRQNCFRIAPLQILGQCQNDSEGISLQSFDIMTTNFVCATVSSHRTHQNDLIQRHLLVKSDQPFNHITRGCIYDFSAISIEIILKLLLIFIVAFGLMLHAMLSSSFAAGVHSPVIAACSYISNYNSEKLVVFIWTFRLAAH